MLDVAIIGAGLAGLEAALRLHWRRYRVVIFEKNATPGGLAQTHRVQGCLVDDEFQVISEVSRRMCGRQQWSSFSHELFLGALDGGAWAEGSALEIMGEGQQLGEWLSGLSIPDHPWTVQAASRAPVMALRYGEFAATQFFENAVTPLLHTVLDWPEAASRNQVSDACGTWLDWKGVPRDGLGSVTRRHVERTRGLLSCGQNVREIRSGTTPSLVLDSGETVQAKAVIVATDEWASLALTGRQVSYRTRVTCWFRGPAPDDRPNVRLGWASAGRVLNTAVVTNVNPAYAPSEALIVATILLDPEMPFTETDVRVDLASLYGVDTSGWEMIWRRERRVPVGPGLVFQPPPRGVITLQYPILDHLRAKLAGRQAARLARHYVSTI